MCFGGGPTEAEREQAAVQRVEAETVKQEEVVRRAKQKREDISEALEGRTIREGRSGGSGRRSLMTSAMGASGYASRFR